MAHVFLFQNLKKTPWRLICKGTAALSWLNHEVTLYSELSETDSKTVPLMHVTICSFERAEVDV